ncbi:Holliday junction branch migration protein RuvA [Pigmentibacter ruber]|uniref:Holliday junction branch migration protein RuvA n=1 Tax=Pigmentibacter ruber TaxID=2683196 RepID=UPI00131D80C7|nr:Holliday junction branch migration protein RuvA [Pigmentibacter ruber]
MVKFEICNNAVFIKKNESLINTRVVTMIGYLKGIIIEKNPESILLNVNSVGYEIEVPATTLYQLPAVFLEAQLYIYTHVREDAIRLFGFANSFDKKVFLDLISVTGVGPKAALGLLGSVTGLELCEIISAGKNSKLTAIPGIGLKTAERLILELKDKLSKKLSLYLEENEYTKIKDFDSKIENQSNEQNSKNLQKNTKQKYMQRQLLEDLKSALSNLGYKDKQYLDILSKFEKRMETGENITIEIALKESLAKLSEKMLQKH